MAVGRLREALQRAPFTFDAVLDALGAPAYAALGRGESLPARRALSGRDDPVATLIRTFLLGEQLARPVLDQAIPVQDAWALGIVDLDGAGEQARAAVDLRPYGEPDTDWWVVSDRDDRHLRGGLAEPLRTDHVLGVGGASVTLARITPRPQVATAADIGTGCGVQALHLSRHAHDVTISDANPRALQLASLTAALSGVAWQTRLGSLFEPLEDERYDLIVSNPPFVVSPQARFSYRDSGLPGDEVGRSIVAQAPGHLAEDGWAVVLANWVHRRGRDWRDRVAAWVEGSGCDAWVAQRDVQDPWEYAEMWLRDSGDHGTPGYEELYGQWLDSLAAMDAEGIGFGWIVLHAAGRSDPSIRIEDITDAPTLPSGEQVSAALAAAAQVHETDAVATLAGAPTLAAGVVVRREQLVIASGDVVDTSLELSKRVGWRAPVELDRRVLDVVAGPAGRTLDERLALLSGSESAAEAVDIDDLTAAALTAVRELAVQGLVDLHPATLESRP